MKLNKLLIIILLAITSHINSMLKIPSVNMAAITKGILNKNFKKNSSFISKTPQLSIAKKEPELLSNSIYKNLKGLKTPTNGLFKNTALLKCFDGCGGGEFYYTDYYTPSDSYEFISNSDNYSINYDAIGWEHKETPYDILEVSKNDDENTIQKAYEEKLKTHNADIKKLGEARLYATALNSAIKKCKADEKIKLDEKREKRKKFERRQNLTMSVIGIAITYIVVDSFRKELEKNRIAKKQSQEDILKSQEAIPKTEKDLTEIKKYETQIIEFKKELNEYQPKIKNAEEKINHLMTRDIFALPKEKLESFLIDYDDSEKKGLQKELISYQTKVKTIEKDLLVIKNKLLIKFLEKHGLLPENSSYENVKSILDAIKIRPESENAFNKEIKWLKTSIPNNIPSAFSKTICIYYDNPNTHKTDNIKYELTTFYSIS